MGVGVYVLRVESRAAGYAGLRKGMERVLLGPLHSPGLDHIVDLFGVLQAPVGV